MKASNGQSLEDVFKKWEKKGEERRLNGPGNAARYNEGTHINSQPGRAAWQQRFDSSALPRRRSNRKKHRTTENLVRIMNESYFIISFLTARITDIDLLESLEIGNIQKLNIKTVYLRSQFCNANFPQGQWQ